MFKQIYVHHPHDIPWDAENLYTLNTFNRNGLTIMAKILKASIKIKQISKPSQRQCYFDDEKYLMFFKIYSKSNCELECLTNITLNECGCVLFWMPRNSTTKICGIKQYKCHSVLAHKYLNLNIATASIDLSSQYEIPYKCSCLPRCNSVTYFAERKDPESQTNVISEDQNDDDEEDAEANKFLSVGNNEFYAPVRPPTAPKFFSPFGSSQSCNKLKQMEHCFLSSVLKNDTDLDEHDPTFPPFYPPINETYNYDFSFNPSKWFDSEKTFDITIEFKQSEFLAMQRIPFYGLSDFVANCGGLLGLFMGLSFLSIVEIIYFLTIRLTVVLRNKRNTNKLSDVNQPQ